MYSSRSSPPTFTPSAVIDTALLSMFWKNAGPVGRYHISLLGLAQSWLSNSPPSPVRPPLLLFPLPLLLLLLLLLLCSRPVVAAGVDGPNMDADPVG